MSSIAQDPKLHVLKIFSEMFNSKCSIKLLYQVVYGKKKTNKQVINLLASEFRQTLNIPLIFIVFINVRHVSKWYLNLILLS